MKPLQLGYILGHFPESDGLFPRRISTRTTNDCQILVFNELEAVARFKQANYLDCKISAFPYYSDTKSGQRNENRQFPNLIFADLDRKDFKSDKVFDKAVDKTLSNFHNDLGGNPTVLNSGHGVHFIQPIDIGFLFEDVKEFNPFYQPSRGFLRYMERRLSAGKVDPCHNHTMSLRNCMLRVPGSFNAKNPSELRPVELLKEWDGNRPKVSKRLVIDYYAWSVDERIKVLQERNPNKDMYHKCRYFKEA